MVQARNEKWDTPPGLTEQGKLDANKRDGLANKANSRQ